MSKTNQFARILGTLRPTYVTRDNLTQTTLDAANRSRSIMSLGERVNPRNCLSHRVRAEL